MNKLIKKYSLQVFGFLFAGLLLGACEKQNLPAKPESSAFAASVENNQTSFPAAGGTANIIIEGGTNGWWITLSSDWATIGKVYGSGNLKVPVTIRPNTTGEPRELVLTVHPTFDLPAVDIRITQSN